MLNELRLLAHPIAYAGTAILGMHGIPMNAWRLTCASVHRADDASDNSSPPSPLTASDEDELDAEHLEEPDEAATGTDNSDGSEDESASYKDFTTFWETRPTRDMSKQLTSHEIDAHKTDLNVATLESWKLKVLTFMRRRHPQFGALLQLTWTDDDNEAALEIVTDSEYGAAANLWGASALLALIDVTKPKGTVFEHELLELERQVPGTMSSGIEIAAHVANLLTTRHTGDEEADFKKLESTQYLKLGMDKDAIKLAIALLQSHLRISPKRVREAPHALFRWILEKAPNEIKEKCDLITERINIAEAAGETVEPIFNGSVLTLQNLSNELVEYIKKASTKVQVEVSAAEREERKNLQVTEWAKKPPCTMCASTAHGWGDCKLKAKCAFLACQCARDKACWVDADEMPTDKELLNALSKPIVGKLKEKLIKCRTDKGKTVSSIEICDERETLELECSVLEAYDLNITTNEPIKPPSATFDDMPTVILTRVVKLAHAANPFVLTPVSRGSQTAVAEYVDGVYEADERSHATEKADYQAQRAVQRQTLAASPSLRAVCATQIQQAAACFLARRRAMRDATRRDSCGAELEISSAALTDTSEMLTRVQFDGGAKTNLFVTPALEMETFVLVEMDARVETFSPRGLLEIDRPDPLIEVPFDYDVFVRDAGAFAQRLADSDGYAPFGNFANGSVRLHFGPAPRTADDDAAARDAAEALDPQLMGEQVRVAIVAIELQEAKRAAELAANRLHQAKRVADFIVTIPTSNKRLNSRLSIHGAKLVRTDVWGHYDEMNDKDYGDIADAWMYYREMIAERTRRAARDDDDDDDPWIYGDPSHVPGGQYIERYDSDDYGDQCGDPEVIFDDRMGIG